MDGRWTIKQDRTAYGVIQWIGGAKVPREATPVVPCDDAAVERAALALHLARGLSRASFGSENYCGCREHAEAVLRAAGEVPS
jgi:hypothetical protein